MEGVFLCLLCLSGWSISSCLPRHYHFVNDPMTWTEAQTYCREKYTDLATVENTKEMDQLKSSVPSHYRSGFVWIGLYSKIQWKWSDGDSRSESDYTNWKWMEPDFFLGAQFCVLSNDKGEWLDDPCSFRQTSLCNRGTQQDPELVFVNETKSWYDAQRYCRENYVDLATVRDHTENHKIINLTPKGDHPWIGLYRDPNMFWSDGSRFSFQFWGLGPNPLGSMSVVCKAADLSNAGKWRPKSCEIKYPFVCYSTARSKHVIKLRMKPDDPSVDLNDPAVKAGLLRELQDQLEKSGLSGVTLKWREQPDGKVFHKEEESSRGREKCDYIVRDSDMD